MRFLCLIIISLMAAVAVADGGTAADVSKRHGRFAHDSTDTVARPHRNFFQRVGDDVKRRIHDKMSEPYDTVRDKRYWWRAMKHGKINFKDSTMGYPKFVLFCYKTYVWGDKAFNSYDPRYVVPTGKNWKLTLKNRNWVDNFMGGSDGGRVRFTSGASSNIGLYLSFMAVSVGYSLDIDRLFGGKATSEMLEFSFTCARFTAEIHKTSNTGRMRSRIKLDGGNWQDGESLAADAIRRRTLGGSATYFFNNRKYARAAAYCFSKYQRISAGSALAGFSVDNHDFKINADALSQEQAARFADIGFDHIRYTDYCLSGGYAYNWVISRKFLLNVTGTVGAGVKHIHSTNGRPSDNSGALKLSGNFALTFNHKRYFASLQSDVKTSLYFVGKGHFGYTIADITAVLGIRF